MIEYGGNLGAFVVFSSLSCVVSFMTLLVVVMEKWHGQVVNYGVVLSSTGFMLGFEIWMLNEMSEYWGEVTGVTELKIRVLDSNGFRRMALVGRVFLWVNMFLLARRVVDRWGVALFQLNTPPHGQGAAVEMVDLLEGGGTIGRPIGRPIEDDRGGNLHRLLEDVSISTATTTVCTANSGGSALSIASDGSIGGGGSSVSDITEGGIRPLGGSITATSSASTTAPTAGSGSSSGSSDGYNSEYITAVRHTMQITPRTQWVILTIVNLLVLLLVLLDIALHGYLHFTSATATADDGSPHSWAQIFNLVTTALIYKIIAMTLWVYVWFVPGKERRWGFLRENVVVLGVFWTCYLVGWGSNVFNLCVLYGEHRWLVVVYITFDLLAVVFGYKVVLVVERESYQRESETIIGRTLFQIH